LAWSIFTNGNSGVGAYKAKGCTAYSRHPDLIVRTAEECSKCCRECNLALDIQALRNANHDLLSDIALEMPLWECFAKELEVSRVSNFSIDRKAVCTA
jgi:hypothetical protein